MRFQRLDDPLAHLFGGRRLRLERDRRVLAKRSINVANLLGIALTGQSDCSGHTYSSGHTPDSN